MTAGVSETRECLGLKEEESEIKEKRRRREVITQAIGVENWRMVLRFGALLFAKMLDSSLDWLVENGQTQTRLSFLVGVFAEQGSSSVVYRKTPMKKRPKKFPRGWSITSRQESLPILLEVSLSCSLNPHKQFIFPVHFNVGYFKRAGLFLR